MIFIHKLVQTLNTKADVLVKLVGPKLRTKTGAASISTAVALALLYTAIKKYLRPPKELRHLATVPYFDFLSYAFRDELFENYSKDKVMPLFKKGANGVYVRPNVIGWNVELANPLIVKHVLLKPETTFPKATMDLGASGTLIHQFLGGPSMVFLSGADWKRHKKIANPAFQRSMPVKIFGNLTIKMFETMESYDTNTIDVLDLFERLTLDAIGLAGFDFDFNALGDKNNKWVHYYDSIKIGMANPFFMIFPAFDTKWVHWFKKRQQVHENMAKFKENLDNIITEKRALVAKNMTDGLESEKDLLTLMIESEMSLGGETMSNEELRSNLYLFMLAGHDTSSNTLAFTLYELAQNPEIQKRAREEVIRVLGDSPEDIIPTLEQTKQLTYINMIMKETMRRHPPAYNTTARVATEDINMAGVYIPKGTEMCLDIYNLHHNPDVWMDPYKFDPERFAPGGEADKQQGIAWAPFSNGARQCIGMNFSLVEQRVVLSMLLKKYTWTLPADSPHKETLQNRGIAWGLVITKDKLDLIFEKRY
ncbi:unnamed protein product [Mucor circinelloides]|uniref:Cytochrome P450 n=1 Tax=Mucor circinelloides f. circinelloides (strain 1006PhL) TaxID=1220926 RepID=S2KEB8_MUCC1|nr:hypothetical protein HMPREF1544_02454 [Mucor circinelloides 1006PhL]